MGKYTTEQIESHIIEIPEDFVSAIAEGQENLAYLISSFDSLFDFLDLYAQGNMDNYDLVMKTFFTKLFSYDENGVLSHSDFNSEQYHKVDKMLDDLYREYSQSLGLALDVKIKLLLNWLESCIALLGENAHLAIAMTVILKDSTQPD